MAKVLNSGIAIVDQRGRVGNDVFFKNMGGNCSRAYAIPTLVQNTYTAHQRNAFAALAPQWGLLTEDQRQTWIKALPAWQRSNIFGNGVTMSPYNLFLKINLALNAIDFAPIYAAPYPATIPSFKFQQGSFHISASMKTFWSAVPTNWYRMSFATMPISAGIYNFKKYLSELHYKPGGSAGVDDFTDEYITKFGSLPAIGMKVGFKGHLIDSETGTISPVKLFGQIAA